MDKMEKLSNPQKTIEVLQKYNFSFQKKFGQNFLIDPHVLDKIIAAAEITKDDFVLEIGPGIGTLTQALAETGAAVTAVELDDHLREVITKKAEADLGTNVVLREHIDKSLLGGILMSANGKRIDASVLSQLESARNVLKLSTDGGEC